MKFEAIDLSCVKGDRYLFRNLSFYLSEGQMIVIQGPNGAGKSSLLKICAYLSLPEEGKVNWQGETSYLGHKNALKLALTPLENILSHLSMTQSKVEPAKINPVLKTLQLEACQHTPCARLSCGQRRKVALASLVLKQKKLWLLDEPLTSLDEQSTQVMKAFMMEHLAQRGMIIIASHLALDNGRVKQIVDLG